jgi:hypothetical protein
VPDIYAVLMYFSRAGLTKPGNGIVFNVEGVTGF